MSRNMPLALNYLMTSRYVSIVAMIRVEHLVLVVMRISRNRLIIDATTNTFLERSRKYLSENVLVVALIVNRFRDKRKKNTNTKGSTLIMATKYYIRHSR